MLTNLTTGETAPAHLIGEDDDGHPVYQFIEGWEPNFTFECDEDGNWVRL